MPADTSRPLYADMGSYLAARFPYKVQKISLHAGFSCPNRDGTKGRGGCTYCNNQTFSPDYCHTGRSITEQLDEGIAFFARKYPDMKYLAYFQAYTNTYGTTPHLAACYEEALAHEGVVGLIIGTRPDCMPPDLLDYLSDLARDRYLMVEYGIESTCDETLARINRGHDYAAAVDAVQRTAGGRHTRGGTHDIGSARREPRNDTFSCRPPFGIAAYDGQVASVTAHSGHPAGLGI